LEAVAASGIVRVVIGMEDPNPLVQGQVPDICGKGYFCDNWCLRSGNSIALYQHHQRLPGDHEGRSSLDGKITYQAENRGMTTSNPGGGAPPGTVAMPSWWASARVSDDLR
jgi:hypothetical protein